MFDFWFFNETVFFFLTKKNIVSVPNVVEVHFLFNQLNCYVDDKKNKNKNKEENRHFKNREVRPSKNIIAYKKVKI